MTDVRKVFVAVAASAALVLAAPVSSLAASPPTIEGESVINVTPSDATLEAQINPQGAPSGVYYQFQVVAGASEYLPEFECPTEGFPAGSSLCLGLHSQPGALPIEILPGVTQTVPGYVDLALAGMKLQPNTTYHYRVLAARSVLTEDTIQWEEPIVYGPDQTFTTPSTSTPPAIDSVSISHLTPTDVTLEAQINTEGLATVYEFKLWSSPCSDHSAGCEDVIPIDLPGGLLLGSFVDQTVSLDLNSAGVTLGSGEYGYSVTATSLAGSTQGPWQTFEAPPGVLDPPGPVASPQAGGGQPAVSGVAGQSAGSGTTPSSGSQGQTPSLLGTAVKPGTPLAGKHKHKSKHRRRHHKAARPAKAKQHKR
jgi:hypothetical protein